MQAEAPQGASVVDWFLPEGTFLTSHNWMSNGDTGSARNRYWGDGRGTEGLRFDMKCTPGAENYLMLLFWGDESDLREFDIYAGATKLGSQRLLHNLPGRNFFRCYPLPATNSNMVTIHLSSPTGTKVGGIFYAYTLARTTSGVKHVRFANEEKNRVYNLSGQLVAEDNEALQRGIYIVGKEKVLR